MTLLRMYKIFFQKSSKNGSHRSDQREPPTEYQFPFLPSYLMAVSETKINQQTTDQILKQNTYFLYNNIV